jgi:poly(A) polymerase
MITKLLKRLMPKGGFFARKPAVPQGPRTYRVDEHRIDRSRVSKNAIRVCETLSQAGFKAYIVGGAVRDLLLGITPKDFDVATDAPPEKITPLFRRARVIGRRFQIVHVMFGQDTIETSTFRALASPDQETDEHGRVLRDNVFGSQQDDATRRDFTVNALYYDPMHETVVDYHNGVPDLRAKLLRMIGDPTQRYREDPVRMLRVVRFAAKLQFTIDEATRAPVRNLAPLLENVPAARLFDEMLKLLTSGHALACLRQLRGEGLHHGVLPLLDVVLEQPLGERFVELALARTDERAAAGKTISPSFLFAALLWHQLLERWNQRKDAGEYPAPALYAAMDSVFDDQTEKLAIQRRFVADMREIWSMQPRFERRNKTAHRLLQQPRFRAAYDFLLLRAEAGEIEAELAQWWTDFVDGDDEARDALIASADKRSEPAGKKRRRRRRRPDGVAGSESGDAEPAA